MERKKTPEFKYESMRKKMQDLGRRSFIVRSANPGSMEVSSNKLKAALRSERVIVPSGRSQIVSKI